VDGAAIKDLVARLKSAQPDEDFAFVELDQVDRAMLLYSLKLTIQPASMDASDVRQLREVGFDDRAIHDICAIVSYFAFVNRIADGLGVELESSSDSGQC